MDSSALNGPIQEGISRAMDAGAQYCDARFFTEDGSESLVLYDGNLEQNAAERESGLGVRVLYGGAWGFAATSRAADTAQAFGRALDNARTAAELVAIPLDMGKKSAITGAYTSPVDQDPFDIPLADKLSFLQQLDARLTADHVLRRMVMLELQRMNSFFWNSEGSFIERRLTNCFASMMVLGHDADQQMQRRSKQLHTTGKGTRGWEMVTDPDLWSGRAEGIVEELAQLAEAPELEYGRRAVILLPGQGHLQVHETIGHPLELDRILGYELSYAGGSFVDLDSFGQLRYGSDRLSASAFGSIENSPGTFGYDDEGTAEQDYLLIDRGMLVNCLTSRAMISEANHTAGREVFTQSGGASRSTAFYRAPIDRMTNVNVLPGSDGTLEDIIAATENGVILDNPTSWSIGSNREHFHFGCEIGWEVREGQITRVLRNPTYQGHTLEFYGNLDAVGDESTWTVEQVPNCGKGEPNQVMEIGHGVPVMRFDDCITGERG